MTIPTFDYEKAAEKPSERWRELGLHWHCYTWRGSGKEWGDDQLRSSEAADITPSSVRAWLRKNPRLIRATHSTPDEAVSWLRELWVPVTREALTPSENIDWEFRFRFALYDLSNGNDLSWGQWVRGPSMMSVGIVGTSDKCH